MTWVRRFDNTTPIYATSDEAIGRSKTIFTIRSMPDGAVLWQGEAKDFHDACAQYREQIEQNAKNMARDYEK